MKYDSFKIKSGRLRKSWLQDFLIQITDVPEHPDYPEHTHEFTELVVVYAGSGINCVDGVDYPISEGDVFVIHESSSHSYRETRHLHLCNVLFDSTLLDIKGIDMSHLPGFHALFLLEPKLRNKPFSTRLRLDSKELHKAKAMIQELEMEVDKKQPGFRLVSQSLLLLLIGELSRWYDQSAENKPGKLMQIAHCMAHMERNYNEPLAIGELARMANMSERGFYRVFQEATGTTPNQYLTNLRIATASELLSKSEQSITDIAYECGFQDSSYMAKQFKKHMGVTPREFRNSFR
ncbi:HTH-type transcriptional activator RhaR [Pontiella desulfatans]|uniref:HTH-type transcriptional activator RhaR n=1 Tax=Pontiella desulfatans TaxID=2750659 RepID=A0A6C2U208_PONDE|nr:helix-turn-helix domain-containing protein [Pontiella desulfatans]VGO14002.1 HTH-type transcriptional activator RhaR [Pontiella desulfatans]